MLIGVVEVIDTAFTLDKYIVPRHECRGTESLGYETEVLLDSKVSIDSGSGHLLSSCKREVGDGVGRALGVKRIISPCSVRVAGKEGVVRCAVGSLPELGSAPFAVIHLPRTFFLSVHAEEVHLEYGGGSNLEIKVRTDVHTVVAIA